MKCNHCGERIKNGASYCAKCGEEVTISKDNVPKYKAKMITYILLCSVVFIIILLVGIIWNRASTRYTGSMAVEEHPIVYVKNNEHLMLKHQKQEEAWEITNTFGACIDEDGYEYEKIEVSRDGRILFFADNIMTTTRDIKYSYYDIKYDLYYRYTNQKQIKGKKEEQQGYFISADVSDFDAARDGSFVVYLRDDELCISQLNDEIIIADDVSAFMLSDDEKIVTFNKKGGGLYIYRLGAGVEAETLYSGNDTVALYSVYMENDKIIYKTGTYQDGYKVFIKESAEEPVQVTEDIYDMYVNNGIIYVTKQNEHKLGFDDLFANDLGNISQPTKPNISNYKTPSKNGSYMLTDYDAYDDAMDLYYKKNTAYEIKDYYDKNPLTENTYALYKIENGEMQKIDDDLSFGAFYSGDYGGNTPIIFHKKLDSGSKVKLSDVGSLNAAKNKVKESQQEKNSMAYDVFLLTPSGKYICLGNSNDGAGGGLISLDEKYFYRNEHILSDGRGIVVKYEITNDGLVNAQEIYQGAQSMYFYKDYLIINSSDATVLYDGQRCHQLKNEGDYTSNWYDDGVYYYFSEYDRNDQSGILMKFQNGEKIQIDTDVHTMMLHGTDVYYLKHYNTNRQKGELYQYKNGISTKIDSDVSWFGY